MTFSVFADNPETYETTSKNDPKKLMKIHEKSVLVAITMELRKRTQKNIEK